MEHIAIIADDLTGANDTGVQFSRNGLQTIVIIDPQMLGNVPQDKTVWAINADTRDLETGEAYKNVYNIAQNLLSLKVNRIYKKIDSTLRGHPGAEIEALMDVWQAPLALVVPAFPANRRIICNGHLVISEESPEALNIEALVSKSVCYVPSILKKEMSRNIGIISLDKVRQGVDFLLQTIREAQKLYPVLVVDAVCESDLKKIANAISQLPGNVVVAGAAGLAAHLTVAWNFKPVQTGHIPVQGNIVLIAGSHNRVTSRQIQELTQNVGINPIHVNTENIVTADNTTEVARVLKEAIKLAKTEKLVVIAVDTLFRPLPGPVNIESSKFIASALGEIAKGLFEKIPIKGLVMTGGDTALHICRALGVVGINLATELLEGIPLGYLVGAKVDGIPVVTKAGGFGPSDSFIKIIQYFNSDENEKVGD